MNRFLSRRVPPVRRLLLVESGSRQVAGKLLPHFNERFPAATVDLLTCYPTDPGGLPSAASVFRVADYPTRAARASLLTKLARDGYDVVAVLCTGEPIMTKWKWAVAWKVPAKLLIVNENGDYFWADRSNWRTIRRFALIRAGFSGAQVVPALARLAFFPFVLLYLVLYAAFVHTQRALRKTEI